MSKARLRIAGEHNRENRTPGAMQLNVSEVPRIGFRAVDALPRLMARRVFYQ